MFRSAGLLTVVGLIGCATAPPELKIPAAEAFGAKRVEQPEGPTSAPGARKTVSPEVWARQFRHPQDCEAAARELQTSAPQRAWQCLASCVYRGGFTDMDTVFTYWGEDLRTRSDAVKVAGQILAARGGNLGPDLRRMQMARFPLFDLPSALSEPKIYKGRYVVFVGRIARIRGGKKPRLELVELRRASSAVTEGNAYFSRQVGFREDFVETNRDVIVRLPVVDPFLTLDRELLFVGRFVGTKTDADVDAEDESGADSKVAAVELVNYFDPSAPFTWQ